MAEEIKNSKEKELKMVKTIIRKILFNLKAFGKPFTSNPNSTQGKVMQALIELAYIKKEKSGRNVTFKWMNGPVPEEEVCDLDEEVLAKMNEMVVNESHSLQKNDVGEPKSLKLDQPQETISASSINIPIQNFSDLALAEELRNRGWNVKCTRTIEL